MNKFYHLPNGTDTDVRPEEGQIIRVKAKGKDVNYEWDDDSEEWYSIPETFTDPEIVEKSKEKLMIGKYSHLRPKKTRYHYDWIEYDMYPYGSAMVAGTYPPKTNEAGTIVDESTAGYKSLLQNVAEKVNAGNVQRSGLHHRPETSALHPRHINGDQYVSCECGALYTANMHNHSQWCPRHEHYLEIHGPYRK
jgi:hypothetical protein